MIKLTLAQRGQLVYVNPHAVASIERVGAATMVHLLNGKSYEVTSAPDDIADIINRNR
jgi:uncharacterized protein YlzI (FlbEa/FlbD family)